MSLPRLTPLIITLETNIEAMEFHQFLDFTNDIFIRNMIIQHPTKTK